MTRAETSRTTELAEKLGEGGLDVVYKAWDLTLGRPVALKFLPGHMADSPEQVTRFRQEVRVISAVNHLNIATIYEIGEAEGQYFMALECLSGGILAPRYSSSKPRARNSLWNKRSTTPCRSPKRWPTPRSDSSRHQHREHAVHLYAPPARIVY